MEDKKTTDIGDTLQGIDKLSMSDKREDLKKDCGGIDEDNSSSDDGDTNEEPTEQMTPGKTIGSVRENLASGSGEGHSSDSQLQAAPIPPENPGNEKAEKMVSKDMGPKVETDGEDPGTDTAHSKILSSKSLLALAGALTPSDAHNLLINLGVPDAIRKQNQKNNQWDFVAGTYDSLIYWKKRGKPGKKQKEAEPDLYNDLLDELVDIGRTDLKHVIERAFEKNRKLEKNEFK